MFNRAHISLTLIGCAYLIGMTEATGQDRIYRWVDADGVAHFSDSPPAESDDQTFDSFAVQDLIPNVTEFSRDPVASASSDVAGVPADPGSTNANAVAAPAIQSLRPGIDIDITQMSLAELDGRCDAAREELIAPQRLAAIEDCVLNTRASRTYCETYYSDFGDPLFARSSVTGEMVQVRERVGQDLAECVDAEAEQIRRAGIRGSSRDDGR